MIAPLRALWKQFTGSQINAIMQALWQYFYDTYDSTLEYWRKLSISTAKSHHLTLIGQFQGLARPLIPIPDEDYLLLSDDYDMIPDPDNPDHLIPSKEYPSHTGFGSAEPPAPFEEGVGHFAEVKVAGQYSYLSDDIFRLILQGNANGRGQPGSIAMIDDILYACWLRDHTTVPPVYEITFKTVEAKNLRGMPGDIMVDLGMSGDWSNPYELRAEIRLLGKTLYYPAPTLQVFLEIGDSTVDPYGFIRILLRTEYGDTTIYGLDSMWAGTNPDGEPSDYVDNGEDPEWGVEPISVNELSIMLGADAHWTDADDPSDEFQHLTEEEIDEMWL